MSKCIFNSTDFGSYYYYTQHIELNNEHHELDNSAAQRVVQSPNINSLTDNEFEFYKTFTHEIIHFLDSTASLWGIEYSIRLFNYYEQNCTASLDVFSLNDSEVLIQHQNLQQGDPADKFEFKIMRTVLSYDDNHGVYLSFKYYDTDSDGVKEVHAVPVSMLAVLEGHAYACENLLSIERYEANNDLSSVKFLDIDLQQTLRRRSFTEYSCILAYVDHIFPKFTIKQKLKIIVFTCEFVLNMPSLGFPFPENFIDDLFKASRIELISALKMEMNRNMNRSSLLCLILTILSISFDHKPLLKAESFENQIEERVFSIFQLKEGNLDSFKESFIQMRDLEYDHGIQLLVEKNIDLVRLSAEKNKNKPWHLFDVQNLELPQVFLFTCDVIHPKNLIDYDMQAHFDKYSAKANALEAAINQTKGKKPHLRPDVYHDWLQRIKRGDYGIKFYPDE